VINRRIKTKDSFI